MKYGKEIFQDNTTQLMTIIVSLALAIVAKKLAGDIANMSLLAFIMEGYTLIDRSGHLSIHRNVLLPFLMYFLSCAFLLWMGVTNLVTCNERHDKSFVLLKILLGYLQLVLFGMLLVISGMLFVYFMVLAFITIILTAVLNFATSFHEVPKNT
ncbi:hypothetical protein [Aquibacillus albus]|uniref:Uncharacterized protein n=1 Tax=Aquibacillus albus TaxID=1168171 RepID=A0ABS2N4G2_9BACI|nr:hypothetical protein [Aquibacillus albus]MBM7573012.1 hypothetical protein [Aquibacillus albus]